MERLYGKKNTVTQTVKKVMGVESHYVIYIGGPPERNPGGALN